MLRALTLSLLLPAAAWGGTQCPETASSIESTGAFGADALHLETSQWDDPAGGMHTCIFATWTARDGTTLRQPLVVTTLPGKIRLTREDNEVVLEHPGGAEDAAGTTYTVRFAFHEGAQRFLAGEPTKSDPWVTNLGLLESRLAAGDLLGARAQVARMVPRSPVDRAAVQSKWVMGTCAMAEALEAEGRGEAASVVALASLSQPPMLSPQSIPAGHLVFPADALAPSANGQWVLPADEGTVLALDGCASALMSGGEEAASLALSKIVVSFEPGHVDAQVRVGDALWTAGRMEEAKGHYHAALSFAGEQTPERVAERAGVFTQAPLPPEVIEVEAAPSSYIDADATPAEETPKVDVADL